MDEQWESEVDHEDQVMIEQDEVTEIVVEATVMVAEVKDVAKVLEVPLNAEQDGAETGAVAVFLVVAWKSQPGAAELLG